MRNCIDLTFFCFGSLSLFSLPSNRLRCDGMIHPFWRSLLVLHTPLALPSSLSGASVGAVRAYVSRSRTSRVESCCRWVVSCRKTLEKCLDFDRKRWCKSGGLRVLRWIRTRARTRMMAVEDGKFDENISLPLMQANANVLLIGLSFSCLCLLHRFRN